LTTNTPKARQNGMLHFRSICLKYSRNFVQTLAVDLLNPSAEHERKQHKLKRLVQSPDSYFMDVKCPGASCRARHDTINLTALFALGCFAITTVFSNAQSVVLCGSCASVLCQPTGGKARLTEGMSSNYDAFACINLNLSQVAHSGGRTRYFTALFISSENSAGWMILYDIVLLSFSFKIHGHNDTTVSRNSECRAFRHFWLSALLNIMSSHNALL
jgi:small subunit ribosomal protein S27e